MDLFTPSFFSSLQQLKIHTRRSFLGSRQGAHLSLRRGHGLEFSDYKPYTPGDDVRHIDWGVYGRTDRVYVRQFREEQDLHVCMLIDGSASMGFPKNGESKFEIAKNIALSLGYVALSDGDSVFFSVLGHKATPKYSSPKFFNKIRRELEVEPGGDVNFGAEVRRSIARLKIPGKCFLFSDFLFDTEEAFSAINIIRKRNFDITVVHVLAPEELELRLTGNAVVADSESGKALDVYLNEASIREYQTLLADHTKSVEDFCRSAGITYLLVSSEESVPDIVLRDLAKIGAIK